MEYQFREGDVKLSIQIFASLADSELSYLVAAKSCVARLSALLSKVDFYCHSELYFDVFLSK